jgi:hypothetical protein
MRRLQLFSMVLLLLLAACTSSNSQSGAACQASDAGCHQIPKFARGHGGRNG